MNPLLLVDEDKLGCPPGPRRYTVGARADVLIVTVVVRGDQTSPWFTEIGVSDTHVVSGTKEIRTRIRKTNHQSWFNSNFVCFFGTQRLDLK